jgi:hypothetical protein
MEHVSGIVQRVIADLEKDAVIQTTGSDPGIGNLDGDEEIIEEMGKLAEEERKRIQKKS